MMVTKNEADAYFKTEAVAMARDEQDESGFDSSGRMHVEYSDFTKSGKPETYHGFEKVMRPFSEVDHVALVEIGGVVVPYALDHPQRSAVELLRFLCDVGHEDATIIGSFTRSK